MQRCCPRGGASIASSSRGSSSPPSFSSEMWLPLLSGLQRRRAARRLPPSGLLDGFSSVRAFSSSSPSSSPLTSSASPPPPPPPPPPRISRSSLLPPHPPTCPPPSPPTFDTHPCALTQDRGQAVALGHGFPKRSQQGGRARRHPRIHQQPRIAVAAQQHNVDGVGHEAGDQVLRQPAHTRSKEVMQGPQMARSAVCMGRARRDWTRLYTPSATFSKRGTAAGRCNSRATLAASSSAINTPFIACEMCEN